MTSCFTSEWLPVTNYNLPLVRVKACGPGSVVGIATGYELDGPGMESRWGRDFSHLSRPALGAHPASCTLGTGSFPGVKSGQAVTLTPHPFLVPWSRKSRAIPQLPLWAVRPVQSLSALQGCTLPFLGVKVSRCPDTNVPMNETDQLCSGCVIC